MTPLCTYGSSHMKEVNFNLQNIVLANKCSTGNKISQPRNVRGSFTHTHITNKDFEGTGLQPLWTSVELISQEITLGDNNMIIT